MLRRGALGTMIGCFSSQGKSAKGTCPQTLSRPSTSTIGFSFLRGLDFGTTSPLERHFISSAKASCRAFLMIISFACVNSSALLVEPFVQNLALCTSLVTARISDFQLEKRSNLCEPSSLSEALVVKTWICGRMSTSASGSMSSNASGCEKVSLAKKAGPVNQFSCSTWLLVLSECHGLQGCVLC